MTNEEIRYAFNKVWNNFKPKFKLCGGENHAIVDNINFGCHTCDEARKYNEVSKKFLDTIGSTYKELTSEDY